MSRILSFAALSLFVVALSGCGEDPAKDVTPAVVNGPVKSSPDPVDVVKKNGEAPAATSTPVPSPTTPTPAAPVLTSAPVPGPTPTAQPGALAISGDTGSKIDFIGSKSVGGAHNGGFKSWAGSIDLSADKKEVSKVTVDIDTTSLWSDDDKLTGHLKNQDFFDVAKFPKAAFVTTEIKAGGDKGATHTLVGNLTLHGVTKSITIPATVKVVDGAVTLTSEFSIKRSDFEMNYTGTGPVKVRDEVVIKLDVKSAPKKA